jgi:predicted metal-dependent peptidase
MEDLRERIGESLLRVRIKCPFFATLMMFADYRITEQIPTAMTDGRDVYLNPSFITGLSKAQLEGLLLHEVLHAALMHPYRAQGRNPRIWNWAADIVVNGMIRQLSGFELPSNGVMDPALEHYSVEEVYESLIEKAEEVPEDVLLDLGELNAQGEPGKSALQNNFEEYWEEARAQAWSLNGGVKQGIIAERWRGEVSRLRESRVDWRRVLWRFVTPFPNDYQGFDRRFIGRGLYLDQLEGESFKVALCIDTSGSIDSLELQQFLSEVYRILEIFPDVTAELFYADTAVHGPFPVVKGKRLRDPVGGGGTSFLPFFHTLEKAGVGNWDAAVYLTDGYGNFPKSPILPTLWVLTQSGCQFSEIPFGEKVRLPSCQ